MPANIGEVSLWTKTIAAGLAIVLAQSGSIRSAAAADKAPQFTALQIIEALTVPPVEPLTRGIGLRPSQQTVAEPRSLSMRIRFAHDSAELTAEARNDLDQLGIALTSDRLSLLRFGLEGHADAAGTDAYNLELSLRRAGAVMAYLTQRFRIPAARLTATGKGERELADPTRPMSEVNRRVVITNLGG